MDGASGNQFGHGEERDGQTTQVRTHSVRGVAGLLGTVVSVDTGWFNQKSNAIVEQRRLWEEVRPLRRDLDKQQRVVSSAHVYMEKAGFFINLVMVR